MDLVQEWEECYIDFFNELSEKGGYIPDDLKCEFSITGVFADGMITGTYRSPAGNNGLFVKCNSSGEQTAGCRCAAFAARKTCSHVFLFLDEITDQLSDYTPLIKRILNGDFDTVQPDLSTFLPDPRSEIQNLLNALLPNDAPDDELADSADLDPVPETVARRIAWNLVLKNGSVDLYPMLQPAKKRGGWAKGRKIPLDQLSRYFDDFSAVDRRIQSLVRIETDYYRPRFELQIDKAIAQLLGEDNVLVDGEPAEVVRFEATLTIQRGKDSCSLRMLNAIPGVSSFMFAPDHMIHFRPDIPRVEVCQMSSKQIQCLRSALRLPAIPLSHEADLLETAKKLQKWLTVQLPEPMAGKVVDEEYKPALLLRSRSDGSLDFGLRLRNAIGELIKPAVGRMLRGDQRNDEPVQVKRSAVREELICKKVANRLGLPADGHEGSIKSFEDALELIQRLQNADADSAVEVLWDKSSEKPLKVLGAVSTKNVSVGITSKRDWFQLSGKCQFDNDSIELSDLLNGLHGAGVDSIRGEYVRLGDKGWAKISNDLRVQFKKLHDSVNQERGTIKFDATSAPAIRSLMNGQIEMKANRAWNECLARLAQSENLVLELPAGLHADLRDYQTEGYKWLRRLAAWGVGGILADDMGLGKTLQTLAVILDRSKQGPTLVIAPTSVGFNWVRECEKFTPGLKPQLYRETDRSDFLQTVGPGDLVVCSYGLALRDAAALAGVQWSSLILDEAQAIKNSRSKTSAAIATIPADWKIALTGTPVENHLGELWSLFHVVAPGVLGGWDQFRRRFAAPIEKDNDNDRRIALRDRLTPFMLRRTKGEVLKDLPARTETNLYVELSPAERAMYDQVRLSAIGEVDQIAKLDDIKDQRFRILALLTRLRQLSCSPRLVHETWTDRSSKLQLLCETLQELKQEGHRVLIFSQFVQHLTLIREMLDEEKITFEYLDGSTTPQARQERVDRFQNGDATAFLISLKAGGTGLNLTAADYVIHMDPWWNPAVEDQATDRAHRIGQVRPVMVYRFVSQGTIEEEILKLHETKRDLVAGIMEGTAAAAKLSTEDLMELLRK